MGFNPVRKSTAGPGEYADSGYDITVTNITDDGTEYLYIEWEEDMWIVAEGEGFVDLQN